MQVIAECNCKMNTCGMFPQVLRCRVNRLRTFRARRISKEIDKLFGNGDVVLGKDICIKPNLLPFAGMAVLENLHLIPGRNPVPPANMFKFPSLVRLGTLLVMDAKETAVFLD
jgi:hypothetical protein